MEKSVISTGSIFQLTVPQLVLMIGSISPYLFLICAEAFSCLLKAAERRGETVGVRVCQCAPSINHLLFADDSLLFKIDNGSAEHLRNVLSLYEDCSGQIINKDKSSIMFSKNTPTEVKRHLMRDLEIESEARNEKYLGLPVYIGRSKTQPFKTMTLASNHSGGKTRVFGLGAPILNSRRVLICYKTCTIIFEKEKNGKWKTKSNI